MSNKLKNDSEVYTAQLSLLDDSVDPLETQQDRSRRLWRENYDRVANTAVLASIDTRDIERAIAYATHVKVAQQPKAWAGDANAVELMKMIDRELEFMRNELRLRERKPAKNNHHESNHGNTISRSEAVRDATLMEKAIASKARPMLDLQKRRTGWKQIPFENGNGVVLVSEDGAKAIPFPSANPRSGTAGLRAYAEAQAFAIDHPYNTPSLNGELVVQAIFAAPASGPHSEQANGDCEATPTEAVKPTAPIDPTTQPLAIAGLNSYRYKGRYGYMMIGANGEDEALREAERGMSSGLQASLETLEKWVDGRYVPVKINMLDKFEQAQIESATVSVGLTAESARDVRLSRIISSQSNPADRARKLGFFDYMLNRESQAKAQGKILEVSYLQGWRSGEAARRQLNGRPWRETKIERMGAQWNWQVYEEGLFKGGGHAKSEVAAEQSAFDFRYDLDNPSAGTPRRMHTMTNPPGSQQTESIGDIPGKEALSSLGTSRPRHRP